MVMDYTVDQFQNELNSIKEKIKTGNDLNDHEQKILLLAQLMDEERNECNQAQRPRQS